MIDINEIKLEPEEITLLILQVPIIEMEVLSINISGPNGWPNTIRISQDESLNLNLDHFRDIRYHRSGSNLFLEIDKDLYVNLRSYNGLIEQIIQWLEQNHVRRYLGQKVRLIRDIEMTAKVLAHGNPEWVTLIDHGDFGLPHTAMYAKLGNDNIQIHGTERLFGAEAITGGFLYNGYLHMVEADGSLVKLKYLNARTLVYLLKIIDHAAARGVINKH